MQLMQSITKTGQRHKKTKLLDKHTLWHATQRLKVHYVLKSLCFSRPLDGMRNQLLIHDCHCLMHYLMDSGFANPKVKGNIIIVAASAQPVEGHCYTLPGWHYILPHADVLLLNMRLQHNSSLNRQILCCYGLSNIRLPLQAIHKPLRSVILR